MSSELERRLEGVFAEAPEPDPGGEEEALHRALRALQPAAPARRGLRTAVLAFAAVVVLLVIAAGSLAAAGALHVSIGAKARRPATTQLVLPKGANGVAAIVDGRLSVVTKAGLGMQGQAVSAAALSPRALYVAAGIGNSLVAMAPRTDVEPGHIPPSGEGRVDRLGAGRIQDRVHRPRRASLRPAPHLRQRDPRHDYRPVRFEPCGRRGGATRSPSRTWAAAAARSSTTSATRAGMSSLWTRRSPASRSRRPEMRSRWKRRTACRSWSNRPTATSPRPISRCSVGSTAGWPSRCPGLELGGDPLVRR